MKRVASETLTKDHGSTPNADSSEHSGDSVSKMANAAQMARRKLATPKSRLNRSTTPTGGAPPSTNPAPNAFASAGFGSQQSQSFQPPSNMFSFGSNNSVSSSFPPSTSQSFNFSAPGSQSFTFGQGGSTPNNPFANINGEAGSGAGNDNTMMDTSPQKAPPIFSFGGTNSTTTSNGPLFGGQQSQSQQPAPAFGGALFGQQSKPEESKPQSNPFGQTSEPKQNGFGPSTGNVFGQNNQSTTSSAPLFGSLGSTAQATSTPASSSPSLFKFGETTSKAPTDSATSAPSPAFGDAFKPSQPLFGAASSSQGQSNSLATSGPETSTSTTSESQPVSKPIFSFGTPAPAFGANSEEPKFGFGTSTSNVFGQAAKSSDTSPAPVQSNLFGQSSTKPATESKSPEPEQATSNPFAGLFGGQASQTTTTSTLADKPKPSFSFGQSTSFGSPSQSTESSTKPATQATPKPAFAFGTPSASSNTPSFSAKTETTAPGALFNLNKPTPSAEPTVEPSNNNPPKAHEESTPKQGGSGGARLFGKTMPAFGTPSQDAEPKAASALPPNPFSSLSKPSTPTTAKDLSKPASMETPTNQAASRLFGAPPSSAPAKPASNIFSSTSKAQTTNSAVSAASNQNEVTNETVQRSISTEGPPQIPRYLSAQKYKSYDENWRLKSLNRQFKDAILQLDPNRHDFMNIIQNYMDHREGIGEGLAFYERRKAGMKRKAGDVDEIHADDASSKRVKPAAFSAKAQPSAASNSTNAAASTSNLFSSFSSPQPAFAVKPAADPKTAELFRSMIPGAQPNAAERTTTPPSSPPKQPATQMPKFEVPKFGGGSTNFMDAFAKQSASSAKKFQDEAKEKRKAEEFDSDEDDEETWNKKYEEEQQAKKAKIASVSQGGFSPSVSNAGSRANSPFNFNAPGPANNAGSTNTGAQSFLGFSTQSGNTSGTSSEKPIEGDDEEGDGSEETTGDDEGSEYEPENGEADEDDLPEDEVDQEEDDDDDDEGSEVPDLPAGQSLFGRITRDGVKSGGVLAKQSTESPIVQPAPNSSYKPSLMFSNIGSSTPDAPGFSPLTPASDSQKVGSSFVPTTRFEFTSTPTYASASSTPVPGASVFSGGLLKDGPIPGEGLFGSRPSTPLNGETTRGNVFGFTHSTSAPNDKTWKPGSAIKFGSPDREAPSFEITEATPPAKSSTNLFGGLFGSVAGKASPAPNNGPSLGFNFGNPPNATGLLAPHLGSGNSGISSGISSRATSPGATDNESVATDNTEDYSNEPQTSLILSNAGEEGERVLFESRAQIQRLFKSEEIAGTKYTAGWNKMGLGNLKVLKNDESGKTRILMRAEPSANILLNTNLIPGIDYKASPVGKNGGAVTFGANVEGKFGTWMLQVKTLTVAEELAKILQDNKA